MCSHLYFPARLLSPPPFFHVLLEKPAPGATLTTYNMFIGPAIVHKVLLAVALGMLTCSTRSALADDGRQRQLRSLPTTNKVGFV